MAGVDNDEASSVGLGLWSTGPSSSISMWEVP